MTEKVLYSLFPKLSLKNNENYKIQNTKSNQSIPCSNIRPSQPNLSSLLINLQSYLQHLHHILSNQKSKSPSQSITNPLKTSHFHLHLKLFSVNWLENGTKYFKFDWKPSQFHWQTSLSSLKPSQFHWDLSQSKTYSQWNPSQMTEKLNFPKNP